MQNFDLSWTPWLTIAFVYLAMPLLAIVVIGTDYFNKYIFHC